jgi:hypothetical protein
MAPTSMRGISLAALLSLVLWSGCKCGQGGGGTPDANPVPPAEQTLRADDEVRPVYPVQAGAPSPLAQRLCEAIQELPAKRRAACCQGTPGVLLTGECVRMLSAALASGAVKVEAPAVDACVQAMEQAHQGCEWVGPEMPPTPAACLGLVRGTLAAGAKCRSSLECVEGLSCHGVGPTDPGVCGAPGGTGQLCAISVDALAAYLRQDTLEEAHPDCQGHCFKRQCADPVPLGGACTLEVQCGPGLHCSEGKCAQGELAGLGQPCVHGGCQEGARCVLGVCATPKPAGAACERDVECLGGCVRPDGGKAGTCGQQCGAL